MEKGAKTHLTTAYVLAKKAFAKWDYPVGGVLLVDETIEIEWQNRVHTEQSVQWHAEIDILKKSEAYRWNKHRKILFVSLEPCNMCANSLIEFWVDEVYYVLEDPVWWGRKILESHGVKVFQIKENRDTYLALVKTFLKKSWKYPELLESFGDASDRDDSAEGSIDPISSMDLDRGEIAQIQNGYLDTMTLIDAHREILSEQEKKQHLFWLIEERMFRYAVRIRDEHGLKTPDEIEKRFYAIVGSLHDYAFWLVQKEGAILWEDLHILHKKLFPKGLWGQCKWPNGRPMRALFPAGEYRKNREFRLYDGVEYEFVDPAHIAGDMALLEEFMKEKKIHPLVRAILYLNKAWYVHPYYNGNGTLFLLVAGVFLLKNGYPIPNGFASKIQTMIENRLFWEADRGNVVPMVEGFLEMFREG